MINQYFACQLWETPKPGMDKFITDIKKNATNEQARQPNKEEKEASMNPTPQQTLVHVDGELRRICSHQKNTVQVHKYTQTTKQTGHVASRN